MTAIPVKVAVRCRPLTQKEVDQGDLLCVHFPSNAPMIVIGKKPFTFNYVFEPEVSQETIYEETVAPLVNNILKGYNATVFAYGQTGSGKTYTMGGAYNGIKIENTTGIIPRVLIDLFNKFAEKDTHNFNVTVSYLEIYNEEVHDLLNINGKDSLNVREDANGIKIPGLTEVIVDDYSSTMKCLESGTLARSVGSTAMNMVSSRSHAIFTLHVDITNKSDQNECFKSKLHLVDLAGSERIKKTHAEGTRLKEGININKGLLCLGNVISCLGEDSRHIPYRDSKLTRLLQDSLGGNSYTLMIACISPADSNMEESLNTLRYADRASKIKNKPLVNHDPKVAEIINLKNQVNQLQMELISITGGKTNNNEGYQELIERVKELEQQNDNLTKELHASLERSAVQVEQIIQLETLRDEQKAQLESALELCRKLTEKNEDNDEESLKENFESLKNMIETQENEIKSNFENVSIAESNQSLDSEELSTPDSRQLNTQHALKQAAMSRELNELNCILAKKQQLANQIAQTNLEELKSQFDSDKKELESRVKALLDEKAELEHALSSAKTSKVEKVSEKRRQKLKELELEVSRLKREIRDKEQTVKTKEQSEKRVTNLNVEIQNLKSQRVKLMKRMKEDNDSFRKWKLQKDKEVNKLLQKDRKRQFEMQKLLKTHEKQQAILKRKSEEASAANKRLKEALTKQRAVRLERQHQFDNFGGSKVAQSLKVMLEREIDVKVSLQETKHYLKSLISDRALLHSQVKELNAELSEPPKKKKATDNNSMNCNDSFNVKEIKDRLKALHEDIRIRNIQITDLQGKIQDGESDKSKPCWEALHSMNEAKIILKSLFEKTVTEKVKALLVEGEMKDIQQGKLDYENNLNKKDREIETITKVFENSKCEIQQKYEAKVMKLFQQLRKFTNEDPNITIDDEMKTKVEEKESYEDIIKNLKSQIEAQSEEIYLLKIKTQKSMQTPDLFDPDFSEDTDDSDSDWVTPYVKKARKVLAKNCNCKLGCRTSKCGCAKKGQTCGIYCLCKGTCEVTLKMSQGSSSSSSTTVDVTHSNDEDDESENVFGENIDNSPINTKSKPYQSVLLFKPVV